MAGRGRKKFDPTKNRKLHEFLSHLEIEDDKQDKIVQFMEELAFQRVKELTIRQREKKPVLRLKF